MEKLKASWSELDTDIVLVSKYSPYRHIVTPLLQSIDDIASRASDDEKITVVLPQFITHKWWGNLLHNNTGIFLRESILRNKNVIVSTYPYHLDDDE